MLILHVTEKKRGWIPVKPLEVCIFNRQTRRLVNLTQTHNQP